MNCPQCATRMSPYQGSWSICYGCAVLADAEDFVAGAGSANRASGSVSTHRRDADAPVVPSLGGFDPARAAVAHVHV
ncbi:MAG: hypothetical protein L0221_19580 [Chloroflexi bacterium]|nr:hypothetical protein [Chloroflexota bacterium]